MSFPTPSGPTPEHDTHLLDVGKKCSDPTCHLVDFLPFKCQHCELSFCQEHFKVEAHHCPKYDESKYNRVAPNCPLCNTPIAVPSGQNPNIRMDAHLEKECSYVTGRVKSKSTPLCAHNTCRKVLFSPIRCTSCRKQFCPAHRFPGDHVCPTASHTAAPSTSAGGKTYPTLAGLNAGAKQLNAKAATAGNAALGAIKSSIATASTSTARPTTTDSKPHKPLPFSSMDRRHFVSRSDLSLSSTTLNNNSTTTSPSTPTSPTNEIMKPTPNINTLLSNFIPRPIFGTA